MIEEYNDKIKRLVWVIRRKAAIYIKVTKTFPISPATDSILRNIILLSKDLDDTINERIALEKDEENKR